MVAAHVSAQTKERGLFGSNIRWVCPCAAWRRQNAYATFAPQSEQKDDGPTKSEKSSRNCAILNVSHSKFTKMGFWMVTLQCSLTQSLPTATPAPATSLEKLRFTPSRRTVRPQTLRDLCGLLFDLFLLPIASGFNRILRAVILKQSSATPTKALKSRLVCPITIYVGPQCGKMNPPPIFDLSLLPYTRSCLHFGLQSGVGAAVDCQVRTVDE
jgi:hypothetical protein